MVLNKLLCITLLTGIQYITNLTLRIIKWIICITPNLLLTICSTPHLFEIWIFRSPNSLVIPPLLAVCIFKSSISSFLISRLLAISRIFKSHAVITYTLSRANHMDIRSRWKTLITVSLVCCSQLKFIRLFKDCEVILGIWDTILFALYWRKWA